MIYTECKSCGCMPKPDEWSPIAGICFDCSNFTKKKSIHELCKEFPDKSYRELEIYRDNDRWEEAIGIGHNHPPKDKEHEVE